MEWKDRDRGIDGERLTVVGLPPISVTKEVVKVEKENPLEGVNDNSGGSGVDEGEDNRAAVVAEVGVDEEMGIAEEEVAVEEGVTPLEVGEKIDVDEETALLVEAEAEEVRALKWDRHGCSARNGRAGVRT